MRASKKDKILFLLIGILVLMGVGYAYLNTNLSISGIAGIGTPTWDVHFENVVVKNGSVETVTKAPTIDGSKTSIDYEITLNEPGDFYEFTVDVKNGGTIDAMIDSISTTINGNSISSIPNYLEYSITYEDGVEIAKNHLLEAGNSVKYKIK